MSNASELPPQVEQSINSFALGQHAPQPLDVIIERDGNYPDFACVLAQLDAAGDALQRGRRLDTGMLKAA